MAEQERRCSLVPASARVAVLTTFLGMDMIFANMRNAISRIRKFMRFGVDALCVLALVITAGLLISEHFLRTGSGDFERISVGMEYLELRLNPNGKFRTSKLKGMVFNDNHSVTVTFVEPDRMFAPERRFCVTFGGTGTVVDKKLIGPGVREIWDYWKTKTGL